MAAEQGDRYATAEEMAQDLERFVRWPIKKARGLATVAALMLVITAAKIPRNGSIVPPPEHLRVVAMQVRQYRGEESTFVGAIGVSSFAARVDDGARVHVELNQPGYCYLIAFNTDGSEQLSYPKNEQGEGIKPVATTSLDYPVDVARDFGLTDGPGMHAFVLLASREPLPRYEEWRATWANRRGSTLTLMASGSSTAIGTSGSTPRAVRSGSAAVHPNRLLNCATS